jgi:myo-inositol-1-phosphate synthase
MILFNINSKMPMISKPCVDYYDIAEEKINYGSFKNVTVMIIFAALQDRIGRSEKIFDIISPSTTVTENSLTRQTRLLKGINNLKRELNAKFELEKKEELDQRDIDLVHILENELPDIIVNMCQQTRNSNDFKNMGGYRKHYKKRSRKLKKLRKQRKTKSRKV